MLIKKTEMTTISNNDRINGKTDENKHLAGSKILITDSKLRKHDI